MTADGRVERVLYDGGSEEAERVRDEVRAGTFSESEKLPHPPVAGRWLYGAGNEDLSK
ncbi:MAG TPA: hypothetical protein VK359_00835 [Rubrobacteraceae bacterium]|nr:hypothetical protein [Rubrobacteraceae bacterium]